MNKRCKLLSELPDGVLAICKPCGILSHPNDQQNIPKKTSSAIINGVYNYQKELFATMIPKEHRFHDVDVLQTHLLHRLDKETSGVMLVSIEKTSADILKQMFKDRIIKKEYYAVVHGVNILGGKREMWWEDTYMKFSHNNKLSARAAVSRQKSTLLARTKVFVEQENYDSGLTLLRLQPHTGYSHQLRYQCALHQCPIIGDDIYGNFIFNKQNKISRMHLHAFKIEYPWPYYSKSNTSGQVTQLAVAEIPDEFARKFDLK